MRQIPEVGDVVKFKKVVWLNASGGTAMDLRGALSFSAKITKAWHDDETGWRYWATLLEPVEAWDVFSGTERLELGRTVFVGEFDMATAERA